MPLRHPDLSRCATGAIVAQGPPDEIVTEDLVREVFGLECRVVPDPETDTPLIIPKRRVRSLA